MHIIAHYSPFKALSWAIPGYLNFFQLSFIEQFSSLSFLMMLLSHSLGPAFHIEKAQTVFVLTDFSEQFHICFLIYNMGEIVPVSYCEPSIRWYLLGTPNSAWCIIILGSELMLAIAICSTTKSFRIVLRIRDKGRDIYICHGRHI